MIMDMNKNKKNNSFNDGVIPSVGKNFANPNNSTNTSTSFYNYTNKKISQRETNDYLK